MGDRMGELSVVHPFLYHETHPFSLSKKKHAGNQKLIVSRVSYQMIKIASISVLSNYEIRLWTAL